MHYDPFARGPHPVGVRTVEAADAARGRCLPVEVWYPATADSASRDTDEATMDHYDLLPGFPPSKQAAVRDATTAPGTFPVVLFSHGFGGHRRQSTFLCTHLASHGYVVAAMDHVGNTMVDMAQMTLQVMMGEPMPDPAAMLRELIELRPADAGFVLDRLLQGGLGLPAAALDEGRVAMAGHSFGGWTTLRVTALDRRIRAALPLAPAGGATPLPGEMLRASLDFDWKRDVPTLFLVADKDSLLPLEGMHELLGRTQSTKRMAVLVNADHMHFCDEVEAVHEMFRSMAPPGPFEEIARSLPPASALSPGVHAYDFNRALGLAHLDATLRGMREAADFLAGDLAATFAARGIGVRLA